MKIQSLKGMKDLLESDLILFKKIERKAQEILEFYGFQKIETPILELTELFERATGQSSEIVQKQMFSFRNKGGEGLSLRPEYTPSIVRAYFEHGMDVFSKPVKLWYSGPCFRYEKPQAGRLRQFHQLGFEFLGSESWILDVQTAQLVFKILESIGFENLIFKINTIGDSQCRPYYKKALSEYFRHHRNSFCNDCKNRLKLNSLRILDCKEEKCQEIKQEAPQILNYLCGDCHKHFEKVLEGLEELEISYTLDPYLVRGLDYYTRTVLEIFKEDNKEVEKDKEIKKEITPNEEKKLEKEEGESQIALGGGGRYDNLAKILGGRETPAIGFSFGIERLVRLLGEERKKEPKSLTGVKIFFIQIGELAKKKSLKLLEEFRKEKIKIITSLSKDSLSAQLKLADKLKIRYVLIFGQKEAIEGTIIVRDLKTGKQNIIEFKKIIKEMKKK